MTVDLEELRSALTGDVLEPADREYERARLCFNLLVDRRPTGIARCLDAKRRGERTGLRAGERPGDRGPRRRPQPRRPLRGRRRPGDRPVPDAERRGGSGERCRGLRGRRDLARLRRRDPGPRPGHSRRCGRIDRGHRTHPRRRNRPSHRPARPHLRQPDRRRAGDAGGRGRSRERGGEPRAALGPARRWRQLRRRHAGRAPAPPARAGRRRTARLRGRRRPRRAPRFPRRRRGGRQRDQRPVPDLDERGPDPDPGRRPLLDGRRDRGDRRAAHGAGARRRRRARAGLPRPAARLRPRLRRRSQLLEGPLRPRDCRTS